MKQRVSRSSFALFAVVLLICIGAFAVRYADALLATHYYTKTTAYSVQVAAHHHTDGAQTADDELLVLVASSTQGWRGSRLAAALVPVGEWLGFVRDMPEPLRWQRELISLRTPTGESRLDPRRAQLERRALAELPQAGLLVSADDGLYYLAHKLSADEDEDAPQGEAGAVQGWRWAGTQFVAVTPEEAHQLAKQQQTSMHRHESGTGQTNGDPLSHDSWTLCQLTPFGSTEHTSCDLALADGRWRLGLTPVVWARDNLSVMSYELPLKLWLVNPQTGAIRTLADDPGAWLETTPAQFAKLTDARMGEIRTRYAGRRLTPFSGLLNLFWLVLIGYAPWYVARHAIVRSINPISHYPDARAEQFPMLDQGVLAHYTDELLARGFVHLRDYAIPLSQVRRTAAFGRLFAHPELKCYAELGQMFPDPQSAVGRAFAGMHISFSTSFAEAGWSLAVSNRTPDTIIYQLRRARRLYLCRPDLPLAQLLEAHLDVRRQMLNRLNLHLPAEVRADLYHATSSTAVEEMRALLKQRTRVLPAFLYQHSRLKTRRHYHWLGDYGLQPAPTGWTPPGMADADAQQAARFQETGEYRVRTPGLFRLMRPWVELLTLTTNTMLWLSIYLWFFHRTYQAGLQFVQVGMILFAFGIQLLVWLTKRNAPYMK